MNKLTLIKGKVIACLFLTCLFLTQSCRKDRFTPADSAELPKTQLIPENTITRWIENNPAAKLISLDWSKARQGVLRGKHVVRIPTLNNDNITGLINSGAINGNTQNLKSLTKNVFPPKPGSNTNYDKHHPPEIFFIQDDKEHSKFYAYLLNFVPKNKNTNIGSAWDGTLYEWNLTGDTILVQQVVNNIIKETYGLKLTEDPTIDNLSNALKTNKIQSLGGLNDRKVSNFWKWLAHLPADVLGWVGHLFGLSVYSENFSGGSGGWRINLSGSGSNSNPSVFTENVNSGGGAYLFSGWPIYNAYIPGVYYENGGTGIVQEGGSQPSGSGDPNATSLEGSFEPYPNHGPNVSLNTLTADYVISHLGIGTYEQQSFLRNPNNIAITAALADYIDKLSTLTQNDIEFGQWAVGYLIANPNISLMEFKSEYLDYTLNPPNFNDVPIIDNGIELEDAPIIVPNGVKPIIGSTTNRNNVEDMTYGTNHDAAGVNPLMLTKSDANLFISMNDLMNFGTLRDAQLRQVTHEFVDLFRTNTSTNTVATNPILNQRVEISPDFANFTKLFGSRLQTKLKETNGDISGISIEMGNVRPKFQGNYNMVAGLTILLNDTEQSTIRLESYDRLPNGKFIAVIEVTIMDHFGLDKHDVLSKQHIHDGFAAWWLLQHNRSYVPFQTKVIARKTVIGHYN